MAVEDISGNLPFEARAAGLELIWRRHKDYVNDLWCEDVTIINGRHHAIHYWPYVPSLTEAREKSIELLKGGNYND